MTLKTLKFSIPQPDPNFRALTTPRRQILVMGLGRAVSESANITPDVERYARDLCRMTGGDPDRIIIPAGLRFITTPEAIGCLPELPPGFAGYPIWMIVAAEARWGAKVQKDAAVQNRSKRR